MVYNISEREERREEEEEEMAGLPGDRSLKDTPTWAVALVCFVMVALSMLMEQGLHKLGHVRESFLLYSLEYRF